MDSEAGPSSHLCVETLNSGSRRLAPGHALEKGSRGEVWVQTRVTPTPRPGPLDPPGSGQIHQGLQTPVPGDVWGGGGGCPCPHVAVHPVLGWLLGRPQTALSTECASQRKKGKTSREGSGLAASSGVTSRLTEKETAPGRSGHLAPKDSGEEETLGDASACTSHF